jgi:hypothetical protein
MKNEALDRSARISFKRMAASPVTLLVLGAGNRGRVSTRIDMFIRDSLGAMLSQGIA